jgi:hypothetical protein
MIAEWMPGAVALLLVCAGWLFCRATAESERFDVLIWTAINHDE